MCIRDSYYTVFGLEGLVALGEPMPPATRGYLERAGEPERLDFVHLTCLARAWATLSPAGIPPDAGERLAACLSRFRSADGGYATTPGAECGSVYAAFLAVGALQDLRHDAASDPAIAGSIDRLRAADGGFANQPGVDEGLTPPTAAAAVLLRHFDRPRDDRLVSWLLARWHPDGGFFASARAPLPDLLSTATALHALVSMHAPIDAIKEPCLDFVDTLWTNAGGFCGSWADPVQDCEYTYYALLALGHLSL